jgi:hypothetical protein
MGKVNPDDVLPYFITRKDQYDRLFNPSKYLVTSHQQAIDAGITLCPDRNGFVDINRFDRRLEGDILYANEHNSKIDEYKGDKGYDNTLADVVRLYEIILSFYDLQYKTNQCENNTNYQPGTGFTFH